MKKQLIILAIFVLGIVLIAQEIQQQAVSINIEVPIRVYKGNNFVDDLKIEDFEIYEDGVLQDVEALYFVNNRNIQTKEEKIPFEPETIRTFYLVFEIVEYTPRLDEAIAYFFENVVDSRDNLTVITPLKTYRLKRELLSQLSKEQIVEQLRGILRKDAWSANSEYVNLQNDLKNIIKSMSTDNLEGRSRAEIVGRTGGGGVIATSSQAAENPGGTLVNLGLYEEIMQRIESIRNIDQNKLLDFATVVKNQDGQKYVFLFYQREFIPQLTNKDFTSLLSSNDPVTTMKAMSLMGYYFKDIGMDINRIRETYADSSVIINFLFFTKPADYIPGVQMVEHSEDIFTVFGEMANSTGGIITSSANPKQLFEKASDSVENYYLLFYSPKNYQADGKFKKIEVKVKGKNYRITHRSGYIAD